MNKSKHQKFNTSFLKKKTPILGFTVLQLVILLVVISSGTTAVVLSQRQQVDAPTTSTNLPSYEFSKIEAETVVKEAEQSTPQNNTNTQSTTTKTNTTSSLPDQYGCIPNTSGYDSCVMYAKKNEQYFKCRDMEKAAYDKYSAVGDKAWATRDAVLAEWKTVYARMVEQNYPLNAINSEEARYKTMAYTDTNAIIKPAYSEYVSTLNSIKSQGCEVTVHTDLYSWPGY